MNFQRGRKHRKDLNKVGRMKMNSLWVFTAILCLAQTQVHGYEKIQIIHKSKPGPCNKRNVGEIILVQDRKGVSHLIICDKIERKYQWRIAMDDGQTGEIFKPGYDCMSILDANPGAKDGFYWITLNKKKAKKAWCDMKTNGGGYILIGRANESSIWAVPSSEDPVEPFGKPHWYSSLGDAEIIDFRVQVSPKEDLRMTKAHWAYIFNTPRKLKKLMISSKGCAQHSPGIGDIKHVKNLATGSTVTSKFRCSKFGIGHHPNTNSGWTMMNSCLEKPCSHGFAFHHKYPIQQDYSGSFSYSASNSISGIQYPATAFVGCSKAHCCGCQGPPEGKQNYCYEKCEVRNGGTNESNVFSWFWVRTSVSKKLWTKCIDYKIEENGIFAWYKLIGNSELPIEGRCDRKSKAQLYDGMLVVPDNTTARKALSIDGMIVYRQDKKKLYVTKNHELQPLAEENETMQAIERLNQKLEAEVVNTKEKLKNVEMLLKALNKSNEKLQTQLTGIKLSVKTITKVGGYNNPGKSCLDILQRTLTASLGNGKYWISLDNKPLRVYCDMKADGGGWTLVSNLVLKESKRMDWSLANDYRQISEYEKQKLALSTKALRDLGSKMSFNQLRFFCGKKMTGRVFDIATKKTNSLGQQVIKYFTAQTNILPKSCGSYYRLPDDNSMLASQCSGWGYESGRYYVGKWHHGGYPVRDRLFNHAAFFGGKFHWLVQQSRGRWECDDYASNNISPNDFWKIFVR